MRRETEELRKKLEKADEQSPHQLDVSDSLRSEVEHWKSKYGKLEKARKDFMMEYEKECNKFMGFLKVLFPNTKVGNLDNLAMVNFFENKAKTSGCESKACIMKNSMNLTQREKEISLIKEQLINIENRLCNQKGLKEELSYKNEVINHQEMEIQKLQQRSSEEINLKNEVIGEQEYQIEILKMQNSELVRKFHEMEKESENPSPHKSEILTPAKPKLIPPASISTPQEEKCPPTDESKTQILDVGYPDSSKENESICSEIIKANIREIIEEISDEKRKSIEHRQRIDGKLKSLSTELSATMRRKLIRYRSERANQIAAFEERIKRSFSNILISTNNEDIRYVENRIRTNGYEINQRMKELEDLQEERNSKIMKQINEIKEENKVMKNQINDKDKDIDNLKNLVKDLLSTKEFRNNYEHKKKRSKRVKKSITKRYKVKNKFITKVKTQCFSKSTSFNEGQRGQTVPLYKNNVKLHYCDTSFFNKQENTISQKYIIKKTNDETIWKTANSKRSKIRNHTSPEKSILNDAKGNSDEKEAKQAFGFAIRVEDQLVLYNKDPRLRMKWGNSIRNENKSGYTRINMFQNEKVFREI